MKRKYLFGSIIGGTMRPQDLIPAFRDTLKHLDPRARIYRIPNPQNPNHPFWDSEAAQNLLEYLFDALDKLAAPYFYFGAHPGDGSDYGFWLSESSLYEDVKDGTILSIPAGNYWPNDVHDYEYVLETNDHGNMALYDARTHEEVWSII